MLQMRPAKGRRPKNLTPHDFARMQEEEIQIQIRNQVSQNHLPIHNEFLICPQHAAGARPPQSGQNPNLVSRNDPKTPLPPIIKYPIEDLEIQPKRNGVTRPELKFFTDEMSEYVRNHRQTVFHGIEMDSMGMLLEVWNTLNVQCEVYVLDSFTFDDFVDTMKYSSLSIPCELFEETHCAVLKLFVDENGKLQVKDLPKKVEEDEEEEESEDADESEISTPMPDVPARSTRSRLSQVESAADNISSPSAAPEKSNLATEMLAGRDWTERLIASDFENGGWQVIVVGILHQLSTSPVYASRCEKLLAHLAPVDEEPTRETARVQYTDMDINLRICALQILTMLTIRTESIKSFLEACSEDMTDVRKRKIEHQREKKTAMEELAAKDRERKILLPDNMPPSPKQESVEPEDDEETIEVNGAHSTDSDDEAPAARSLRRAQERKRKRDEEAARQKKEKAEKIEAAKAQSKQSKEFRKVLNEIEDLKKRIMQHEEKIQDCDSDLREANVQRTKVLGKDRFCNRYYWFERNGQPFGGLPRSSTSSYGYANGRIWVQGPDAMEREGFIDRTAEEQAEYQKQFHMTVSERRRQEEGATILENAQEWGFYDDPDRLENLIGWLDDRGDREKKLRKELMEWRDMIVKYMDAHKKFKDEEVARKIEADEEQPTRITTRHKTHEEQSAAKERCLKWKNTMALEELGHIHSRPLKARGTRQKKEVKGVAIPVKRQGKPVTRQGDKHSFK